MAGGGFLKGLAYREVPRYLTRMQAIKDVLPGALLMDTGGAALLGALSDSRVRAAAGGAGAVILNIGNQHTFAAIVREKRVLGLFEHHTAAVSAEKIVNYMSRLLDCTLTSRDVQEDTGHGCIVPDERVKPALVAVTGPRRAIVSHMDYYFAAPFGNMMLMGCFCLVSAVKERLC